MEKATNAMKGGCWPNALGMRAIWALTASVAFNGLAADLPPDIQADRHLVMAEQWIGKGNYVAAKASLDQVLAVSRQHDLEIPDAFWFKYGRVSFESREYEDAVDGATRYLQAAGRKGEHYLDALELLNSAELAGSAMSAGDVFRDCPECPEMVVVPSGSFRMGSPTYKNEQPVHRVTIREPFAVGRFEVTFAEWDACLAGGGCGGYSPSDDGLGRGRRPVNHVSWDDAKAYVAWLSRRTGQAYRLPSESEWEYAARAGTATAYSWGDAIGVNLANCRGCGSRWDGDRTAPVGSFAANPWGLHDMHGNIWEWTEDCWNDSYAGAPSDGSAWLSGTCAERVLRGGPWTGSPWFLRVAYRFRDATGDRNLDFGFRVARTLAP